MVEYITYKGLKHPIRVSYYALKKIKEETGKDLDNFDFEFLEPLLHYALIAGYKAENLNCPFKREDIEFVLDEAMSDFIKLLPKFFGQISQEKKAEAKKK